MTKFMKQRVVITGAAGFIGSHLAETLLDRDYTVVGIDNLLTGATENISHLVNRDFTFIKHDVTNYIYIDGPVDFVLHWASPASPIDYLELPIPTLKVGALGTHKALGLAKAKGATFVLASTSEVYGDPLEHPQKESYWGNVNPIGPRGVYDEAKRFAEAMTVAYHRYHGLDAKNVGNPREMTIEEIARTIIRMTGATSKIIYKPLPTDDPKVRQPDITRARTLLGWEPKVPLEEGLVKTIEYFRTKVT